MVFIQIAMYWVYIFNEGVYSLTADICQIISEHFSTVAKKAAGTHTNIWCQFHSVSQKISQSSSIFFFICYGNKNWEYNIVIQSQKNLII